MLNSIKSILPFYIIAIFLLSSCASKKDTVYFQSNPNEVHKKIAYVNQLIQENDILNIAVSALDMTSVAPFIKENGMNRNSEQSLIEGYKVALDGSINLPLVGNIAIAGLSTSDASIKIEKELSKSIIDPIVNVHVLNCKITVLGEVNSPGTFTVYDPKINIIQALGLAGDITIEGKRKNIKLIRRIERFIICLIIQIYHI